MNALVSHVKSWEEEERIIWAVKTCWTQIQDMRDWNGKFLFFLALKVKVNVTQSCLTLYDPLEYTVYGILQDRILEWVAFPFSMGSSQPRNQTRVFCIAGGFFKWIMREALLALTLVYYSPSSSQMLGGSELAQRLFWLYPDTTFWVLEEWHFLWQEDFLNESTKMGKGEGLVLSPDSVCARRELRPLDT